MITVAVFACTIPPWIIETAKAGNVVFASAVILHNSNTTAPRHASGKLANQNKMGSSEGGP